MGDAGRERAVEAYSLQAHAPRLVDIMQRAVRNA
jgi:glycosyltransferase involved in cell wall biosynthesis